MVESEEKTLHLPREVPSFLLNALPSWENKLKKKKRTNELVSPMTRIHTDS